MDESSHSRRAVLRATTLVGAIAGMPAIAGCLGGPPDETAVLMDGNFAFDPEVVTVAVGGTVLWENDSDVGHTVTAYEDAIPDEATYFASGGFESERAARNDVSGGMVAAGDTYEHTFEVAGTYEYYCIPHEGSGMVGTVEVE